ncbi:MAG: hypothetical protein IT324_28200 [Anaerolineae bacterium]|nr:hypothetical protein [Anaerolineae bacterium]
MRRLLITVVILALVLPGQSTRSSADDRVNAILQAMTLEQRVGQLFMVSVYGKGLAESTAAFLQDMMPGGVALFTYNGSTPQEMTQTVNAWQSAVTKIGAQVPLLVAIDQEGGTVARLTDGFTPLPWGGALGAMPPDDARKVGQITAEELSAVGITMNLAPVVDVRTEPDNLFIERRALGTNPEMVGMAGAAFVQGMLDRNMIGTLKHFPGHGPAGDSHTSLPVVNYDRARVESEELVPFLMGIKGGAEVVMVGHLVYPALDPTPSLPASLSPTIIQDVLRKQLGFDGVVMTDAVDMGAITDHFDRPTAAVMAIKAGIDLIATGPNMPMTEQQVMKRAIIDAVKRGDIAESRIEDSVRRILALKAKHNLLDWSPLDPAKASQRVNSAAHQPIVDQIYLNTITIAQDSYKHLPLTPGAQKVAVIFPGAYPSVQRECTAIDKPFRSLAYSLAPTIEEQAFARTTARDADVAIIFTYNIGEYPSQAKLVNTVPPEKAIVVSLQNPFDIERGIQPGAYVAAFNSYPAALKAVCAVLYGKHPAVGRWQAGIKAN